MLQPLSRARARELDAIALQDYGLSELVLMENAGLLATLEVVRILHALGGRRTGPVRVFCGGGSNGGDGYVIARQLLVRGVAVECESMPLSGASGSASGINREIAARLGISIHDLGAWDEGTPRERTWDESPLIIDALLGTGFTGEMRPSLRPVIHGMNALRSHHAIPIVAIDLPSGLDCDTGRPAVPTVEADFTLTMAAPKLGLRAEAAEAFVGDVRVIPIGFPVGVHGRVGP